MRVTICWAEASSYAAACFRALSVRAGITLRVVHLELFAEKPPWQENLFAGISNQVLCLRDHPSDEQALEAVAHDSPEVIVLSGWLYVPFVKAALHARLRSTRLLVGMDTPWRGSLAQRLNRYRLRKLVRRASRFVVAGERSRTYARHLGVPESRIALGYYGCDHGAFAKAAEGHRGPPSGWPRSFLFAGRYIAEKDLETLVAAYQLYRQTMAEPWSLACTGIGPLESWLNTQPHVQNLGYTQPGSLPPLLAQHGALVLPSRYEPWGVVIAEAAASGLPVICTTACGAGVDIVRPYYNGLIVAPGDVPGLARAMRWIHEHVAELPAMGRRGQALAAAFSAEAWAARWHNYFLEAMDAPPQHAQAVE